MEKGSGCLSSLQEWGTVPSVMLFFVLFSAPLAGAALLLSPVLRVVADTQPGVAGMPVAGAGALEEDAAGPGGTAAADPSERLYRLVRFSAVPAALVAPVLYLLHLAAVWVIPYRYTLAGLFVHHVVTHHLLVAGGAVLAAWWCQRGHEGGPKDRFLHLLVFLGTVFLLTGVFDTLRYVHRWTAVSALIHPLLRGAVVVTVPSVWAFARRNGAGIAAGAACAALVPLAGLAAMWGEWLHTTPAVLASVATGGAAALAVWMALHSALHDPR